MVHLVVRPLVLHLGQVREAGRFGLFQHPVGDVSDGVPEHGERLRVPAAAPQPLLQQVLVERVAQSAGRHVAWGRGGRE